MKKNNKIGLIILLIALGLYFATHLPQLTNLPVFADEAIYLRWAQLIIDDWQRYLFFPMNDGKTPLFIWWLVPFVKLLPDPLWAGRLASVIVGAAQLIIIKKILEKFEVSLVGQVVGLVLTTVLPFWYFHHRMALMDGMLTLFISWSWLFLLKVRQIKDQSLLSKPILVSLAGSGIMFGLALLTKVPAILFLPAIFLQLLFIKNRSNKKCDQKNRLKKTVFWFSLVSGIGLSIFASLKLHPAFGQLFNRGGDFLFSSSELISGSWRDALINWPNYFNYFQTYLTWPVLTLAIAGLIFGKKRKEVLLTNLSGLLLILPMIAMGKVVYARYLLPIAPFITTAAVIGWDELRDHLKNKLNQKKSTLAFCLFLLVPSIILSSRFIDRSWSNVSQLNLVPSDKVQYLTEWSAGFGIKPTVKLIERLAKHQPVLIATEGYFGTLPDGLLMYFHNKNVNNIFITGIGQPIHEIPVEIKQRANYHQRVLLVVNSHRLVLNLGDSPKLLEVCRPNQAPCHQVWDITAFVKNR
ncbi:MAG: phospholipid carrier-dependent glycosyltransferase [Candidatus Pacebacteria bacterium]|nr:phospholipid carrier-dependent glycosyltransferase [Candidatus Paceibacterota bacterium]